jgi:ornithine decarboxylase
MMSLTLKSGDRVPVATVVTGTTLGAQVQSQVASTGREDREDPFYLVDLGRLVELHQLWSAALPGVHPFYAVKCNNDPVLLQTLAALGCGFDCASKAEIKSVLDLDVCPDRIIYANPCKQASHLKYACKKGVATMTFDNEVELHKVCPFMLSSPPSSHIPSISGTLTYVYILSPSLSRRYFGNEEDKTDTMIYTL